MESAVKRSKRTVITDDYNEDDDGNSSEDDVLAIVQTKRTMAKGSKGGSKGKTLGKKK